LEEFRQCKKVLEKWTVDLPELEEAFNEIDKDKSGQIDFDEFCH
jgi:Ca2+-binding EF-hand superfamily protein